jgi:hypothetical protein
MALHVAPEAPRRMRAVHSNVVDLEVVEAPTYQIRGDRPPRSRWRRLMCKPVPTPTMNDELPLICICRLPAHLTELGALVSINHEGT